MREFLCPRCASYRFVIQDLEDGFVEVHCMMCDRAVKFKKVEDDKE